MRHIRGHYVDQASLVRLLQATSAPVLKAAQRAGDAAIECNDLVRKLPCMQAGPVRGCQMQDAPIYVPLPARVTPTPSFGLRLALVMMLVGLIGVAVGGYLADHIPETRNQTHVSNPIRECVRSDWSVVSR
jgi:hypothetical protein